MVRSVHLNEKKRIFRGEDTEALQSSLVGQTLERSETHGKQMLFVLGERHWLGIHLGMTGETSVQPVDYKRQKHDHLVLEMESGLRLVYSDPRMFGRIRYATGLEAPDWWAILPPQILSESFTIEYMQAFLKRRAKAPIKAVLLMQEAFPGVGNWMADEILWRCRIYPAVPAGCIGSSKRIELFDTLKEVCREAIRVIGTDWNRPPDNWLFNHRWKDGGTCPATGKPLCREPIGGRTTCWSPSWQTYRGKS